MQTNATEVEILKVSYLCSTDKNCAPRVAVLICGKNGKKRTIFLSGGDKSPLLIAGTSVVITEERTIENRFAPQYTLWKNMAAYKRSAPQK